MFHSKSDNCCLLFVLMLVFSGISVSAQESSVDYNQKIIQVLEGYQKMILEPLDSEDDDVPGYVWYVCRQAIEKGFLRFTVDPVSDSLIEGARFYAEPESNTTYIIVTTNVLDFWSKHPSTAYVLLTGAFRDASRFFQNLSAWQKSRKDTMEQLFMKLDQYTVEARLIRDRLLPSSFLLSSLDSYILDSFEKDGLASVLLYLEKFSLPVAQGMYDARLGFEENTNEDDLRNFINNLGEKLLESRKRIPPESDDNVVFPQAIAIHTWLEFSPHLIARIHNRGRKNNPFSFDEILDLEPDYTEIRRLLEASRTLDTLLINHVLRETIKGFEAR